MLDRLTEILSSDEFEHDGWFELKSADVEGERLLLHAVVNISADAPAVEYRITCTDFRAHRIEFGQDYVSLDTALDHPVLLPYETQAQLYFSGSDSNVDQTLGRLWATHKELCGDWIPFGAYFNSGHSSVLQTRSGLFAKGPQKLLLRYAEVLRASGLRAKLLGARPAVKWNGREFVPAPDDLQAMLLDDDYVVARRFDAERLG